ncbi:hypothetical protein B0H13DRAFT_2364166 [Mycena leptocephala]|nr:hypothetical protein B0H13DRAFT_2364166 [Mycena leptocephala]
MLIPPPPCAETSPSPSPPRKPTTVYVASHTNQLAHTRLAHAHPYIRRHRSNDLHRCIGAPAVLSILWYASKPTAVVTGVEGGARAVMYQPCSITRSDAQTARRHPHPQANPQLPLIDRLLRPTMHAAPCISIFARVPRTRHPHGRAHPRPPLPSEWIPCHQRARISAAHTACGANTPHRNLPRTQENQAVQGAPRTRTFAAAAPAPAPDSAVVVEPIPVKVSGA